MNTVSEKRIRKERRHARIRARVRGTLKRPRLAVYKSNTAITAQLINDDTGATIAALRTDGGTSKKKPTERAFEAGKQLAEVAKAKGITEVVFDRGGVIYTGRVKAFADGAREGGLLF